MGGSNITGEINYPPLHSVLNANSKGDKIFQRAPNISEIFVPGDPKISIKLKYTIRGSKYFEIFGPGN